MTIPWYKKEINGLVTTSQKWRFILFTTLLLFLFIHIFEPFGIYNHVGGSFLNRFWDLNIAIVGATLVLMFTQFFVRKWFGFEQFTILSVGYWFLLDVLLVGFLWWFLDYSPEIVATYTLAAISNNLFGAFFIVLLPYVGAIFILDYQYNRNKPHESAAQLSSSVVLPNSLISFKDEKGVERISIQQQAILYLKSSGNYVVIHYLENDKPQKFLLRNSIKKLIPVLAPFSIIRCHRSYMINVANVISKKKNGSGFEVKINYLNDIEIPISKAYSSEIDKIIAVG